jgi:hypothetical protein
LPGGRSGHSLTFIGNSNYLLYGGIENAKDGKIAPNADCYVMKMTPAEAKWTREQTTGDEKPLPRTQHIALSTPKNDKVFVFGGHSNPKTRMNDTWFLNVKEFEWTQVVG